MRVCNACLKEKLSRSWHDYPNGTVHCEPCYDKARIWRKDTCLVCLKEKTTRWDRNPRDPTTLCCNSCNIRMRKHKIRTATSKKVVQLGESLHEAAAVDARSSVTQGQLPEGSCKIIQDTCRACLKEKTTRWDRNPNDPTTLCCHACYVKLLRIKGAQAGITRVCNDCLKEKLSRVWFSNSDGTTNCEPCHYKIWKLKKGTCDVCLKEKTTRWDKNPNDPTTLCCYVCYSKALRVKKRQAAAEVVVQIGESPHPAANEESSVTQEQTPRKKNTYAKVERQKRRIVSEAVASDANKKLRRSERANEPLPLHNHSSQGNQSDGEKISSKQEPIEDDEHQDLGGQPLLEHNPQNSLPILQDPDDPSRSLLLEQEGAIEQIERVSWYALSPLLEQLPLGERLLAKEKMRIEMRSWLTLNEFHREAYAKKLDNLGTVIIPEDGPSRGRSLFAKRKIEQFNVIGPYSGALHTTKESLKSSIASHGSFNTYAYLFETRSSSRNVDAFGKGNILSLINTGGLPNQAAWKENNLVPVLFGKNLTFFVATRVIKKGEELLVDYGATYNPK